MKFKKNKNYLIQDRFTSIMNRTSLSPSLTFEFLEDGETSILVSCIQNNEYVAYGSLRKVEGNEFTGGLGILSKNNNKATLEELNPLFEFDYLSSTSKVEKDFIFYIDKTILYHSNVMLVHDNNIWTELERRMRQHSLCQ